MEQKKEKYETNLNECTNICTDNMRQARILK